MRLSNLLSFFDSVDEMVAQIPQPGEGESTGDGAPNLATWQPVEIEMTTVTGRRDDGPAFDAEKVYGKS